MSNDMTLQESAMSGEELLDKIEAEMFSARGQMEVLWLRIGSLLSEVTKNKLFKFRKDDEGNYYRTATAYFGDLEKRFKEKGLPLSYTGIYRFINDFNLYQRDLGYTDAEMLTLGKSALDEMAPTVRKLMKEHGAEKAREFVDDILESAQANGGLPLSEVRAAVDEATGRVMKGLDVEFKDGLFGRKMARILLWWDGASHDLLKEEINEEQAAWVSKRLSVKVTASSPTR